MYTLTGYNSATPIDTYADASVTSATSISATIDVAGGGATVFVAGLRQALDSWSSAVGDYDNDGPKEGMAVAHITGDVSSAGHSETMTMFGTAARSIAAVTWR